MNRQQRHASQDLSRLTCPEGAKVLVDVIQGADFEMETLRRIRDAAAARLEALANGRGLVKLREEHEAIRRAEFQTKLTDKAKPSVETLAAYLVTLQHLGDTTCDQKREIVRAINYWKRELGAELFFQGTPCTLKVSSTENGRGAFQLRRTGSMQASIYGNALFPTLTVDRRPAGHAQPTSNRGA